MRRGFTLIEMAVVMVILGLVVVGATKIASPVFDSQKYDLTLERMTKIQQAIQVYVIQYGCLPCPANAATASTAATAGVSLNNSGATYVTSTSHCTGPEAGAVTCYATAGTSGGGGSHGMVPWITLGLSEEDAVDGWNHRIRYDVASSATPCTGGPAGLQYDNGMVRCALGGTPAYPAGNMTITDYDTASSSALGAYVLLSSGSDGSMAFNKATGVYTGDRYGQEAITTGQGRNYIGSNSFAYGSFNATTGTSHFDDILRTTSAPVIIQKCGANGCGNPA